jgi:hypothetical protein
MRKLVLVFTVGLLVGPDKQGHTGQGELNPGQSQDRKLAPGEVICTAEIVSWTIADRKNGNILFDLKKAAAANQPIDITPLIGKEISIKAKIKVSNPASNKEAHRVNIWIWSERTGGPLGGKWTDPRSEKSYPYIRVRLGKTDPIGARATYFLNGRETRWFRLWSQDPTVADSPKKNLMLNVTVRGIVKKERQQSIP